jgi:uncharacterized protein
MMRKRYHAIWAALLALGMAPAQAQPASPSATGPSFTCTPHQGPVEDAICGSPTLSAADREMAALYAVDRISAFGSGPSNQLEGQRRALHDMQGCATSPGRTGIAECLKTSYDERNYELAISAATRAPDLALPVIRRVDAPFAPVAEAVVIWASEPEHTDWSAPAQAGKRARILALLKPVLNDYLTQGDTDSARSMLDGVTGNGTVRQVEDLLAEPDRLAGFLDVLGPALSGGGAREIPCAAIVGHPHLLGATASAYGATPDNFVFNTDCEAALPPLPTLARLDGKLRKAWPACDGTIRFAAYRQYRTSLDAARLGIVKPDPKRGLPARKGVSNADVTAARTELAAYYARYLGKTPPEADHMATDALGAVLDAAQNCD